MKVLFKFIFNLLTDSLSLPINYVYEYVILAVIGIVAFALAFWVVGKMYEYGIISGGTEGSFFHWLIRGMAFIFVYAVTYSAIKCYYFVKANLQMILIIAGAILGVVLLCTLIVSIIRIIKKCRKANSNA